MGRLTLSDGVFQPDPIMFWNSLTHWGCSSTCYRITPHVTNFSRLRLSIEKQEGKRKYKSDGGVRDARAYIRPLVPRLPRKSSGAQGTPEGRQRDARAYIRSLAVHIVPRLPRKVRWVRWGEVRWGEGRWVGGEWEVSGRWVGGEWEVSGRWVGGEWEVCGRWVWVSEWGSEWVCEWGSEWVSEVGSEWVSQSVSESVSHSVSEWVSEGVRTGGREEDGADTELKTKTPHVNVGKNVKWTAIWQSCWLRLSAGSSDLSTWGVVLLTLYARHLVCFKAKLGIPTTLFGMVLKIASVFGRIS